MNCEICAACRWWRTRLRSLSGHLVPKDGAEDVDDPVVEHHWVFRIEVLRPVDPFGRVPLLLFALGIELEQRFARLVVFPGKAGFGIAVELPLGLLDRKCVAVRRRHRAASRLTSSGQIWGFGVKNL